MSHLRYLEGYAVVVHSRAEAYPLQGWFERRQRPPSSTPPLSRGPAAPDPPAAPGVGYPARRRSGGPDEGRGWRVAGTSSTVIRYGLWWYTMLCCGI